MGCSPRRIEVRFGEGTKRGCSWTSSIRDLGKLVAARKPRQVLAQNVYRDRGRHEDGTHPETPITMHALPIGTRPNFSVVATISFVIVSPSSHFVSIPRSPRASRWYLLSTASGDVPVSGASALESRRIKLPS